MKSKATTTIENTLVEYGGHYEGEETQKESHQPLSRYAGDRDIPQHAGGAGSAAQGELRKAFCAAGTAGGEEKES